MSDVVVITYEKFQEYQERRRQAAPEPNLPERPETIEPESGTIPSDTTPRQTTNAQNMLDVNVALPGLPGVDVMNVRPSQVHCPHGRALRMS
jgi:hypothetical protein